MMDIIKELWYKARARAFERKIKKCTAERRKINAKQRAYKEKHEKYSDMYREISKL